MSFSNSNSNLDSLKQPFTQDEIKSYKSIFQSLDKEQLNILTGDSLKQLFIKSGITNDLLAIIWSLADFDNKGFLTFDQFAICCRLIGYIQAQGGILSKPLSENDFQFFVKIPDFSGNFKPNKNISRQASFIVNRQASNASLQSNIASQIPLPSAQEIAQFAQLFDSYSKGQQFISGDDARDILQKSKLPTQALVEIWNLADQNDAGFLTKDQFVIAMFLVQLLMSNRIGLPLPEFLPPSMWSFVKQNISNSQIQQRSSSPLQRNLTNNSFNSTPVDQWALNVETCKSFDAIFHSLDKAHRGKLGSDVLVPYFMDSGLSQDTLAVIWDLSDINNNAEFTNVEFSIAMFLIQKSNSGVELPDIVPQSLLNSSLSLHNKADGPGSSSLNVSGQPSASSPSIPNRESKPNLDHPQHSSSKSPLNDLLTLDNTGFSSPNTTGNNGVFAPVPVTNSKSVTPIKKFKPSSSFGQSIIPEEQEPIQEPPTLAKSVNATPSSPLRYNYTSTLPAVPNFASISSPINGQRSSSVSGGDNSTSMAISNATTDIANLSTQTRSLSNQTKMVQDRKQRAEQELNKILSTKASIEQRLASLRQAYTTESALADQAEKQVQELTAEVTALEEEYQVLETNYNTVKQQHDLHNNNLSVLIQKNTELKQKISDLNNNNDTLNRDLDAKKQEIVKHEGLVSVTERQLEVSELNSDRLQKEIESIEQNFTTFLSKKSELDEYEKNLQEQHGLMQSRHAELEEGFQALNARQQDLEQKTLEIQKQEEIYNENVKRLQEMFADFQVQQSRLEEERQILEENEMKLENDRNDYLDRAHAFATQDLDDHALTPVSPIEDLNKSSIKLDDMNKNVETSEGGATQLSADLENLIEQENIHKVVKDMDDVPVQQSTTSSMVNNGSETQHHLSGLEEIHEDEPVDKGIPGEFEPVEETINTNKSTIDEKNMADEQDPKEIPDVPPKDVDEKSIERQVAEENASFNNSPIVESKSIDQNLSESGVVGLPISGPINTEEFPPIKELEYDESDSSDYESDEVPAGSLDEPVVIPDDFDDFDGLEAAQEDDEDENSDNEPLSTKTVAENSANPEWDALFQGLEKSKPEVPEKDDGDKLAVSPKDLAIEELIDMGFTEEDSIQALEKFNWHLESAAQYLITKS
ncbi:hypothetical protein ACO0R3_002209 [Hanseniaspora guilliermondii]